MEKASENGITFHIEKNPPKPPAGKSESTMKLGGTDVTLHWKDDKIDQVVPKDNYIPTMRLQVTDSQKVIRELAGGTGCYYCIFDPTTGSFICTPILCVPI